MLTRRGLGLTALLAEPRSSTRTSCEVARDAALLGGAPAISRPRSRKLRERRVPALPRERPPPKPSVQEGSPARSCLLCPCHLGYRALGLLEDDEVSWFWIGTHAAYDHLIQDL